MPVAVAKLAIAEYPSDAEEVTGQLFLEDSPFGLEAGKSDFAICQLRHTGRQGRKSGR